VASGEPRHRPDLRSANLYGTKLSYANLRPRTGGCSSAPARVMADRGVLLFIHSLLVAKVPSCGDNKEALNTLKPITLSNAGDHHAKP
jgi:hypothetical protein